MLIEEKDGSKVYSHVNDLLVIFLLGYEAWLGRG